MKKVLYIIVSLIVIIGGCTGKKSEIVNSKQELKIGNNESKKDETIITSEAKELVNQYIDSLHNLRTLSGTVIEKDSSYEVGYAYGYSLYLDKSDTTKYYLILEKTQETTTENPHPKWKILDAISITGWTFNQMENSLNTHCRDNEFSYFSIVDKYIGEEPQIKKTFRLNHITERLELTSKPILKCVNIGCGDDEDCD